MNVAIDDAEVHEGDMITWEESKLDGRERVIHEGEVIAINDENEVAVKSFDFDRVVDVSVYDILTINGKEV